MANERQTPAAFDGWLAYLDDLLLKGGFYGMAMNASGEGIAACNPDAEKDPNTD